MNNENRAIAIVGGVLIDGTGSDPVEDSVVVINGSKIVGVGENGQVEIPEDAETVDSGGKTVMPGLIDSHLHFLGYKSDRLLEESLVVPLGVRLLRASISADRLLSAGFTTVKDCGCANALHIKRAIAEGILRGPRILAAGYVLTQTFGHGDTHFLHPKMVDVREGLGGEALLCDGVEECTKAARYALREGADFIKLCGTSGGVISERDKPDHTQFSLDEIKAVVQTAHNAGTFVTAHAQGAEGIINAIEAGCKTVDHAYYPREDAIDAAKRKQVVFVPTLSVHKRIIDGGVDVGYPPWGVEKAKTAWNDVIKNIRRLREAEATIAMGTDFLDTPLMKLGTNAVELELLVKSCGFEPMQAIVSATLNGAKACGLENRIGTVETGKLADILIVDGDPLKDIRILQDLNRIKMVMKEGRIHVDRSF